jgi:hypothetical protein
VQGSADHAQSAREEQLRRDVSELQQRLAQSNMIEEELRRRWLELGQNDWLLAQACQTQVTHLVMDRARTILWGS